MTEFTIAIGSIAAGVSAIHESTGEYCSQYLTEATPDFTVCVQPEDIALEREKATRENEVEGLPARSYTDAYLELTAVQRKITERLFDYDTLLFHGSTIAVDNQAYLFTAKSGTGKSTHTRLWRELLGDRAIMVNDDKPFLEITKTGVIACGSPWNGKHRLGNNIQVPLKAICILERGEENSIEEITPKEALMMLIQQSSRPEDPKKMGKYLDLLDRLAQNVKLYKMRCAITPQAAKLAYETMEKE